MMSKYEPLVEAMQQVEETSGQDDEVWSNFQDHWQKFMDFSWCSQWDGKKYDVVFYGASGYSGYLMMEFLKRNILRRNPKALTFALAGRTASKVTEMRDRQFKDT